MRTQRGGHRQAEASVETNLDLGLLTSGEKNQFLFKPPNLLFCDGSPTERTRFTNPFTLIVDCKTSGQFAHCVCEDHSLSNRGGGF